MKRLFAVFSLALILAGCGGKEQNVDPQANATGSTVPSSGWYEQGSAVELETEGAIRLYRMQTDHVSALTGIGDKLLLICPGDVTELSVLSGTDCTPTATLQLNESALGVCAIHNAVAYFQADTNEAVYLDQQLQEISRIKLPADLEGTPLFAPDGSEIYYCVGQEIRAYDTSLNITRPVKSHSCVQQKLTGIYFDGKVLSCEVQLEDTTVSTVYFSTSNGATLSRDSGLYSLATEDDAYVALRMDGVVRQHIVGTLDDAPKNLNIPQNVNVVPAVGLGGIVTYETDENSTTTLAFYDTASGLKTAEITVSGIGDPQAVYADQWSRNIWLLATEMQTGQQILCSWELAQCAVTEQTAYLTPVYTAKNPDVDGLDACEDRADEISDDNYVDIRICEDAVDAQGPYTLTPEYQTVAIHSMLDNLEAVLSEYPDRFFYKSVSGTLRISLVREISGGLTGAQYWQGNSCYIVLTADCDIREAFTKALGYVVNSRILAKSPLLDDWDNLNPEGFAYGQTMDETYLAGDNRAFADKASMESVTDDRSILFAYAMGEGNQELFSSPVMQEKLTLLCMGIRDAWRWEEKAEVYPWEQYLKVPLAPEK